MNTCFNLDALLRELNARQSGNGSWMAHCPGHDDKNPSLAISQSADGKVLLHCFAGCSQGAVTEALRARGLWPEGSSTNTGSGTSPLPDGIPPKWKGLHYVAQWAYLDPAGNIMGYVVRYGDGAEHRSFHSSSAKAPGRKRADQTNPGRSTGWIGWRSTRTPQCSSRRARRLQMLPRDSCRILSA